MKQLNVFILAAGLGERLRPITDHIPKPLLPVLGKTTIESVLEKVSLLPVIRIGINSHHKWQMIHQWVHSSPFASQVDLFREEVILGTGGALRNAEAMLYQTGFLVHNADIISDIPLERLLLIHNTSKNMATLAVHHCEQFNTVWLDDQGCVHSIGREIQDQGIKLDPFAFTGIAVYSPEFLQFIPQGSSSVVEAWKKAIERGCKIGTVDFTGCYWRDMGTPSAYYSAVFEKMKHEGEVIYIDPSVDGSGIEANGNVVLEKGCNIGRNTVLRNCVLLDGALVPDKAHLENCIVGPGYHVEIDEPTVEAERLASESMLKSFFGTTSEDLRGFMIGTGGSERKYYRIRDRRRSAIVMQCTKEDPDYLRHLALTEFLARYSVPVPAVLGIDVPNMKALLEDMGDLTLYSWLKLKKDPSLEADLYMRVVEIMTVLHTVATDHAMECPELISRIFDFQHFRWETSYFLDGCVRGIYGLSVPDLPDIEHEFDQLAEKAALFPKTIVHRDFQSQNIMITKGDIPRVIDFQGARMGPPAYDLASLLWDPYHQLNDARREILIAHYLQKMEEYHSNDFDKISFMDSILPCRLQRHMQALGAYGFLARERKKTYFLKYIPTTVQYLNAEAEAVCSEYPYLYRLIRALHEKTHN